MTHQRSEDNSEHKAKYRTLNLLCSHIYSQPATGSFVSAQPTQIPLRATRAEYFFIFNLGISTASHTIRLQPLCVIIIHITMSSSKAALALLHLTHPTQLHLNYAANTQSIILNLSRQQRRNNKLVFPSIEPLIIGFKVSTRAGSAEKTLSNNQSLTNFPETWWRISHLALLVLALQLFHCFALFCFSLSCSCLKHIFHLFPGT